MKGNEVAVIPTPYVIHCSNTPPIAGFKFLSSGVTGQPTVAHSDEDTRDPDNGLGNFYLGYHYFLTQAPPKSRTVIEDAGSGTSQFIPDVPGKYEVGLIVDDCIDVSNLFVASIKIGGEGCNAVRARHRKNDKASLSASFLDSDGQTCTSEDQIDDDGNGCTSCRQGLDATSLPVNVATGAMWHNDTDFMVEGRTPETGLFMSRFYTANAPGPAGELGPNWRHAYETTLISLNSGIANLDVEWIDENANPYIFRRNQDNSLGAPRGSRLDLREFADRFELTKPNKTVLTFSKAPYGKLIKIKERHGEAVDLTYDSNGYLATVTAPFADSLNFIHQENGKISSVTRSRDNLTYSYEYDSNGRLSKVTDFAGKATRYTYITNMPGTYANGMLATITDPLGRVTTFTYDSNGRALEQFISGGGKNSFVYSASSPRTTVVKDFDGASTTYRFDKNFRTIEKRKSDGGTIHQAWNDAGFLSSYTDELGYTTSYTYDENGNIASIQRPDDSGPSTFQYNLDFNVPTQITPVVGASTSFTLDPNTGEILRTSVTTQAGELAVDYTRDSFGKLLSVNNGRTTYTNQRDENGLVTYRFDLHNPETIAHDSRGRVATRTFQSGQVLQYTYDDYDRVVTVVDSAGPTTVNEYDAIGRILKRTMSDGNKLQATIFQWDDNDRLVQVTDAMGRTTKYSYEKWRIINGPSAITDPAGRVTRFEYDSLGRRTKRVDPQKATTTYAYNLRGDLTSATDALGNITSYEFDGNGRKISETRPSMQGATPVRQTTRFTYDDVDNILNIAHESTSGLPNRNEVYSYDELNRLIKRTLLNDGSINEANYTYEPQLDAALLKTVNNEVVNLAYTNELAPPFAVSAFSQAAAQSGNPLGLVEDQFSIARDVTGEIATVTGSGSGVLFNKAYDPAGRLSGVDAGGLRAALRYDGFGRKAGVSFSSGETESIAYDSLNRVTSLKWRGGSEVPFEERLTYDIAGNVVRLARENGVYDLKYDEMNQLVQAKSKVAPGVAPYNREFNYDLMGNRIGDSVNGPGTFASNFLLSNGKSNFEADQYGFGELAKETSGNGERTFAYRADQRMTEFSGNGNKASYFYDGLNRRIAKAVQTRSESFTNTYVHLAREDRVVLGKAGNGAVTKYIDGQGVDEHLMQVTTAKATPFVTNHIGTVMNSIPKGEIGVFGELQSQLKVSSSGPALTYGFAGREIDPESGLSYNRARYYDPNTGRWTSIDPLGLKSGDLNYYRYVYNAPMMNTDPTGESLLGAAFIILGVAVACAALYYAYVQLTKNAEEAKLVSNDKKKSSNWTSPTRGQQKVVNNNGGGGGYGGGYAGGGGGGGPTVLWGYGGSDSGSGGNDFVGGGGAETLASAGPIFMLPPEISAPGYDGRSIMFLATNNRLQVGSNKNGEKVA